MHAVGFTAVSPRFQHLARRSSCRLVTAATIAKTQMPNRISERLLISTVQGVAGRSKLAIRGRCGVQHRPDV
jgi:hypothetical protein